MVETRRSSASSSSKRSLVPSTSSSPKPKRLKEDPATSPSQDRLKSAEPSPVDSVPAAELEKRAEKGAPVPMTSDGCAPAEEKEMGTPTAMEPAPVKGSGESQPKAWARLLSQCSQLTNEKLAMPVNFSRGTPDAHDVLVKGMQFETRTGDPSALNGASILASLSNPRKDPSALSSPESNHEEVQQEVERCTPSTACDISGCVPDLDHKCNVTEDTSENDGKTGVLSGDKPAVPASADLSGSSASKLDLSGNILKVFEDHMVNCKSLDSSAAFPATRCQAFKEGLKRGILNASDIDVSFENFPYYLRSARLIGQVHMGCLSS